MELVFESTKQFEKDLLNFEKKDQARIIEKLNYQCGNLLNDRSSFFKKVSIPFKFKLKDDLQPSLYCMRISPKIRIILTMDEDPLFNQIIITLIRVVSRAEIDKAYKSIGESLYQKLLFNEDIEEGE